MKTLNNIVNLTDEELSLVATSLQMTIMSYEKYVQTNGGKGMDHQSKEAYKEMKKLYDKITEEYF